MIIGLIIGGLILPIAFVILLAVEQRDKTARQNSVLPARKYHDITDQDVTIVHTIVHK